VARGGGGTPYLVNLSVPPRWSMVPVTWALRHVTTTHTHRVSPPAKSPSLYYHQQITNKVSSESRRPVAASDCRTRNLSDTCRESSEAVVCLREMSGNYIYQHKCAYVLHVHTGNLVTILTELTRPHHCLYYCSQDKLWATQSKNWCSIPSRDKEVSAPPALGPTQSHIQFVMEVHSSRLQSAGRQADH
jgi:hypothetical protein